MTDRTNQRHDRNQLMDCSAFQSQVSEYIEGSLKEHERTAMDAHLQSCDACSALVADLFELSRSAKSLPLLTPSRDLWSGIAARLDTPVTALNVETTSIKTKTARHFTARQFAAAAALLITVSSGATWLAVRGSSTSTTSTSTSTAAPSIADNAGSAPTTAASIDSNTTTLIASSTPTRASAPVRSASPTSTSNARFASRASGSAGVTYEREINAMRRIVEERLGELDSTTVTEIERNLAIIDKAINDSRRALARDPNSHFLNRELDRALETKLSVLRKVALL